ncbi:unnamed protein product [Soboliphyme baturini]|uniref:Uncharacterized protein n=1 Tax=Soboliphyme baturini TaxID=241478 RepID=A0A183IGM6_9BILA|nr:unnamed protein product [Soboliphyme baturini]
MKNHTRYLDDNGQAITPVPDIKKERGNKQPQKSGGGGGGGGGRGGGGGHNVHITTTVHQASTPEREPVKRLPRTRKTTGTQFTQFRNEEVVRKSNEAVLCENIGMMFILNCSRGIIGGQVWCQQPR